MYLNQFSAFFRKTWLLNFQNNSQTHHFRVFPDDVSDLFFWEKRLQRSFVWSKPAQSPLRKAAECTRIILLCGKLLQILLNMQKYCSEHSIYLLAFCFFTNQQSINISAPVHVLILRRYYFSSGFGTVHEAHFLRVACIVSNYYPKHTRRCFHRLLIYEHYIWISNQTVI